MNEIKRLVSDYKIDVESIQGVEEDNKRFGVEIMKGSNEGYYVVARTFTESYYLRFHDYNEAAKCMGVMMILIPTNL